LEVRFDTEVRRVDRADGAWRVETNGDTIEADAVVIAIGFDHVPHMPDWPGLEGFGGELIHAPAYHDPEPYRGRDVLVVGPGVTGSEVAHLIAIGGAARVRVACRTPPHIVRRKWLGAPIQVPGAALHHMPLRVADRLGAPTERMIAGNLSRYGLPRPLVGPATALAERHQSPPFDDGFVDSVKAGRIEIVAAVEGFEGDGYRTELSGQMRLMRFDARSIARALTS
jgi:putative flavoprotein involved in K+ transport